MSEKRTRITDREEKSESGNASGGGSGGSSSSSGSRAVALMTRQNHLTQLMDVLLKHIMSYLQLREYARMLRTSPALTRTYMLGYTTYGLDRSLSTSIPLPSSIPRSLAEVQHRELKAERGQLVRAELPALVSVDVDSTTHNVLDDVRRGTLVVASMAVARGQTTLGYRTSLLDHWENDRDEPQPHAHPNANARVLYWQSAEGLPYNLREPQGILTLGEHKRLREAQMRVLTAGNELQTVMAFGDDGLDLRTEAPLLARHKGLRHLDLDCLWPRSLHGVAGSEEQLYLWENARVEERLIEPFRRLIHTLPVGQLRWLNLSGVPYLWDDRKQPVAKQLISQMAKWITTKMPLLEYLDMGAGRQLSRDMVGWLGTDLDVMSDMLPRCRSLRHFLCFGDVFDSDRQIQTRKALRTCVERRDKFLAALVNHQPGWVTLVVPTLREYEPLLDPGNVARINLFDTEDKDEPHVVVTPLFGMDVSVADGYRQAYLGVIDGYLAEHLFAKHHATLESFTGGMIIHSQQVGPDVWSRPSPFPRLDMTRLRSVCLPSATWKPIMHAGIGNCSMARTDVFLNVRHLKVYGMRPVKQWMGLGMPNLEQLVLAGVLERAESRELAKYRAHGPRSEHLSWNGVPHLETPMHSGSLPITIPDVVQRHTRQHRFYLNLFKRVEALEHLVWKNPKLKRLSVPLVSNLMSVSWDELAMCLQLLVKWTPELTHLDLVPTIVRHLDDDWNGVYNSLFHSDTVSLLMLFSNLRHLQVVHFPYVLLPLGLKSVPRDFPRLFLARQFQRIMHELGYERDDPDSWMLPIQMSEFVPPRWRLSNYVDAFRAHVDAWSVEEAKDTNALWKDTDLEEFAVREEKGLAPPPLPFPELRVVVFPTDQHPTPLRVFLYEFCDIRVLQEVRIETFHRTAEVEDRRQRVREYALLSKDINRDRRRSMDVQGQVTLVDNPSSFHITLRVQNVATDGSWEWRPVEDCDREDLIVL